MKIIRAIIDFLRSSKARKGRQRALAALMAVVVFCTTYTLILPAITLDNQTAETEPGIEVEKSAEETLSDVQEADLLLKGQNADDADAADAGDSDSLVVESADEPAETEATVSSSENEVADTEQAATSDDAADVTAGESAQDTEEETQEVYASSPLTYHCDEYDIELSFDSDDWQLPEGTQLSVKELRKDAEEDSEEYRDYHYYDDRAKEELSDQDEELADRAYALHYYELELKADGEELSMPEGKADVTIKYNPEDKSDYNAKEFGDEETVLASLFWLSDWHTNLFDENDDESKIYTIKDHQLKKIQIKDVEMSDFDNVIGLFACPPEKKVTLKAEGSDYSVTAVCGQKSKVPEDAKLTVSEIKPGSKEFDQYLNSAREALGEEKENNVPAEHARFFDIKIMVDGEEFTPEAEIDVKINFHEPIVVEQMQDVNAVHFGEEGTEVLDAKTEEGKDGIENVSFSADSFSVYGVVYTVDFTWEVDGKEYEFSLPGGGFVSLKTLMEIIGVTGDSDQEADKNDVDDAKTSDALILNDVQISGEINTFVADIQKVEFSNPDLVWIGKTESDTTVGSLKDANALEVQYSNELTEEQIAAINAQTVEAGDWALISMLPFTTEETLTITMQDGDVFTVKVTDGQLHTYVISADGETYEIIVTYDDSAEIPEDAKLEVREIKNTEEKYTKNIEATNKELLAQEAPEVEHPVQFEISIISKGEVVEPKEGSTVKVEMRLVPEVFVMQTEKTEANENSDDDIKAETEEGEIWFNGEQILGTDEDAVINYTVSHIKDDGTVEVIDDVSSSVNEDDRIVVQFETESFSDYLVDTGTTDTLSHLPNSIYVGDVIYLYDHANYTVNTNGGVVSDIRIANNNEFREVKAEKTGWFTITAPAWGGYDQWGHWVNHPQETKTIQVYAERTGTTPPPLATGIVNNADVGINLNLFDYDLDNSLNDYYNQFNHSTWPYLNSYTNDGINNGHAFKFWGSGVGKWTPDANNLNGSQINWNYNHYSDGLTTGIVKNALSGGYPALSGGGDLKYLFDSSEGTALDKKAYLGVDNLFRKESPDSDYYVYNSNSNYAWYNPVTNKFEVYNSTYEQKSKGEQTNGTNGKAIGFFPFHRWDRDYDLYVNWNKKLNHHFGLSMSVDFSLPKAPKAVKDKQGNDIIFEFSGDDDMWVFIDGKLAMDIGGIHQPVKGKINFTKKTVTTQATVGDDLSEHTQSYNFPDSLYDGNPHKLEVFYIERGGCDSNCMIKFNLTQYVDVEFDKVDTANVEDKLSGAVFGLYLDEECTKPLIERLNNGTNRSYVAKADENGHIKFDGIGLGTYYLKELVPPDGYEKDDTIRTVNVFLTGTSPFTATYTISGPDADANTNRMQIGNKMPEPIKLSLEKKWQDEDGTEVDAPQNASAVFELHRIRSYEIIEEEEMQQEAPKTAKLIVGWINGDKEHVYKEYTLLSGSRATVSWRYKDGYTGDKACYVDETRIDKNPDNQVFSQGTGVLSENQVMKLNIVDSSDDGDGIASINVAGEEYVGGESGGIIHSFETVTEPDTTYTYTGDSNVVNNRVTLNASDNWSYEFTDLPIVGKGKITKNNKEIDVVFNYSYYLSEVSSENSAGAAVVYVDGSGKVIGGALEAETHTTGTQTIINKIPFGYLQIEKKVTYNGSDQNLTADQKSKLAGIYKFKIYTKQQCGVADAVQDPNAPEDAEDKDLIITITIDENGQAVSSDPIKLLAGNYWIKEVESSNPMMFPVTNPITAPVTKDNTTNNAVISSLTNNYDENNGPDKISIDIEKKFQGLDSITQIPAEFQVTLQYKIGNKTKTCTLGNGYATGQNGETITFTTKDDGFTWHWHVGNIDPEAEEFKIKESNYDKAKGYDWKKAFLDTVVTTGNEVVLNTIEITDTVEDWHNLNITAPKAVLSDVTNDRRTSDSHSNTEFYLDDTDVLLSKLTGNHGITVTLVISKHPLNLMERDAVKKGLPNQFKDTCVFYSMEEHPNGFQFQDGKENKKVTFGVQNGRATVKFTQGASAQESVWLVNYSSQDARNNANLVNTYEETPITIDIIKVDEKDSSKKLPGAIFTLRQIADVAPVDGELRTLDGTNPIDSDETDDDGKTSFGNLTHGYYEITEKNAPDGYIKSEEITSYFKIENGVVKWLVKGNNKPSKWTEKTAKAEGELVDFDEAHPAVEANPELHIEAQPATNAVFTVENEPGAALPSTGGPGTRLFTILGIVLIAGAGMLLWRRRRLI